MKIIDWIKKNKLVAFLIFLILFLLYKNSSLGYKIQKLFYKKEPPLMKLSPQQGEGQDLSSSIPPPQETSYFSDFKTRLTSKEAFLSLLVNDVAKTQKEIIKKTEKLGGFLVNSTIDNPQFNPTATVIVRLPSSYLEKALEYFKKLAVKVIHENIYGMDITDQYIDIEAKLKTLYTTKEKFEEILNKATKIEDLLNLQREIINLQSQIDTLKGQKQYLEQNTKLAKITIYLSTDELALPYTPSESWRPKLIFKQAVRSLIGNLRKVGTILIWLTVYSLIWLPIGIIAFIFYRKKHR